jgi:UDP-glucose 4-epimerase
MAVCLVIGGAGFLGSHLVEALVADRHVVRVLDNFTTGKLENLAGVMDAIELYPGDFRDRAFGYKVARGVELVFHFGLDADQAASTEASCTARLLSAALQARARRVVFASSMHVYGRPSHRPADEADTPEPLSVYGRSKLSSETACVLSTRKTGLETVCLRYFNVFGPRQPPASGYAGMIRTVLEAMPAGRSPVFEGDERFGQDLIYVEDAVHAALLAARAPRVSGKVYNIARGQPTTCREVVDALNSLLGTRIEPLYSGVCPSSNPNNLARVGRAEMDLGFCAATDLRRGLSRCLEAHTRRLASCTRQVLRPFPHPLSVPKRSSLG